MKKRAVEREVITDILWDAAQAPTTPVRAIPFSLEGVARIADLCERYACQHRIDAVGYSWADRPEQYCWDATEAKRMTCELQSDEALKVTKPNWVGSTLPCMKNPMPGPPSVYVGSVPVTIS